MSSAIVSQGEHSGPPLLSAEASDIAVGDPSNRGQISLETVPAGPGNRRVALAVIVVSTLVFIAIAPFARVQLAQVQAFIASYEAALAINDLITFLLLFGLFYRFRSAALLVLAGAYLFDALIMVVHALTYPGLFSPTGLLDAGRQTTAWLYMFWHGGFPIFVIGYALLQGRIDRGQALPGGGRIGTRGAIAALIAIAGLVAVLALITTAGHDALPAIIRENGLGYTATMNYVDSVVWALSFVGLLVLWRKRTHSIIDVWLMVVMIAWIFDIAMSVVLNAARFDLGFYAGRIYGLLAASFVLGVLLAEANGLHSRLTAAKAALEDHARKLEENVRERTRELQQLVNALQSEIAERKRTEAQLVQAQKMEAIGNLTGGMAHDFNNLLGIVIGNLDLLQSRLALDADNREALQDALDAASKGADLTRRLLAFARRQPLQPARIDVNPLVENMARLLGRTLGERIEISLDTAADLWPVIADPSQLEATLTNLATNARDSMPKGGRLTIVTANRHLDADYAAQHADVAPGDYAMIEVSDSGTGMIKEVLSRIFEPFFTTKERSKGTGLGLSMVFGFMKQSGGHINVYSEPGKGTTFRLYLPRTEDVGVAARLSATAAPASGRGESVLVVEDNPDMRRIVVRQLKELGYRVLEAESADAALPVLGRERVDLLFTDVVMPGEIDGFALANIALGRWPHLKVVLTSGFPKTKVNGNLRVTQGGARLLTKPYRQVDLARALREALDRGRGA